MLRRFMALPGHVFWPIILLCWMAIFVAGGAYADGGVDRASFKASTDSSAKSAAAADSASDAEAISESAAESESYSKAVGEGGSVGDVSTSVEISNPRGRSKVTIKNVPDTAAPGMYSANPCVVSRSGALALVGGAISGGSQKVDPGCERRQMIGIAFTSGLMERGTHSWCLEAVRLEMYGTYEECADPEVSQEDLGKPTRP